jgi:hypothetical protein
MAAARASETRFSMLPEVSRRMAAAKGVSSTEKRLMDCSRLSSNTLKSERESLWT